MITIDSQIWIYYWDINALEHDNVKRWLNGEDKDGILFTEDIILSVIIPIEVGHHLFKQANLSPDLDADLVENLFLSLLTTEKCQLIDIDAILFVDTIQKMKNYILKGIGGRDTLILATMDKQNVNTIATHDKNILSLDQYKRIDPVFKTPMILDIGEKFNEKDFKQKLKEFN